MPSFQDSALIIFLALLLFGPKKLPELARQLGKLMAEFRRASNEFRMQMEEELRLADQAEQQKKLAAIEAAAPKPPAIADSTETASTPVTESTIGTSVVESSLADVAVETPTEPIPIASSGELHLMPPETGLPQPRDTSHHETTAQTIVQTTPEASPHG